MLTDPISANSVIGLNLNWGCITPAPTCNDLPSALQKLIDTYCADGPDYSGLDFGCVTPADNLLGVLQNVLNEISCDAPTTPMSNANDLLLTGLLTCQSDTWSCNSDDSCIPITNLCEPGDITVKLAIQTLMNRLVAYGNVIKSQCASIDTLQTQVAALTIQVNMIQSSCCGA